METTMKKRILVAAIVLGLAGLRLAMADGNPLPRVPHDAIIIHVQKGSNGPKLCDGGHSLFLRYGADYKIPDGTLIQITMIDWVQVDNDTPPDGLFDEDPVGDANGDG